MLHAVHEWLVDWADSPLGPLALFIISAAESIFFPIPPDPLLIALALRDTSAALLLALITTAGSVVGGVVGHWLGKRFGRPLLARMHSHRAERAAELVRAHGFWAVLLAGLTPLPYKVFTIAAGAFEVPRTQFIIASIIGRGARFFLIGGLIFLWGDRFESFLEDRLDLVLLGGGAFALLAVAVWILWVRRSNRSERGGAGAGVTLSYDGGTEPRATDAAAASTVLGDREPPTSGR